MRLKSLIKCHLAYLLSKSSLTIIMLIIALAVFVFASNAISAKYNLVKENIDTYFVSSITIIKIIYCVMASFIIANAFNSRNDSYFQLLISSNIKKSQYFLTKLISIALLLFIIIFVLMIIYILFGYLFIKGFVYEARIISAFFSLYLIASIYGMITCLIMISVNNIFVFLIPSVLAITIQEVISDKMGIGLKVIVYLFPTMNSSLNKTYYSYLTTIIWLIALIVIDDYVYVKHDFNYE